MAKRRVPQKVTWQGHDVVGQHVAFSGKDEDLGVQLPQDEPLVLVVRGRVTASAIKTNAFGVDNLVQSFKVDSAIQADDDTAADVALRIKERDDALSGQESLDAEMDGDLDG